MKYILLLCAAVSFAFASAAQDTPENDTAAKVYTIVEVMPKFPGGNDSLLQYIIHNVHYPDEARLKDIEGTVYVSFVVDRDGYVKDTKILRGIGYGCDEEALRVAKGMPRWTPGTQNEKAVRVQFTLPVKFDLLSRKELRERKKKAKEQK